VENFIVLHFCGSERFSWSLRNEAPTIWRHVGNSWYQPAGVRTWRWDCRISYSNQNLVLTKSCRVELNRSHIRLSSWCHWGVRPGVNAGDSAVRRRSNLTRFSQFQLNLDTLWFGKWGRLTEIAISSSFKSIQCRRFSTSKCDVGFWVMFVLLELLRSRLFKWRCSAVAVWNALLGCPSWVPVEIRDGFLSSGFIHGISRTKQRAHICSSP